MASRTHRSSFGVLHIVAVLTIVYVAIPLVRHLFISGPGEFNANPPSSSTPEDKLPAEPTPEPRPAIFSLAEVRIILGIVYTLIASILSYSLYIPKLAYLPVRHAFLTIGHVADLAARPLWPILAPFMLAFKILLSPIILPAVILVSVASSLYPLYVFLGAACICGAVVGLLVRLSSSLVSDYLLGESDSSKVRVKGKRKERL